MSNTNQLEINLNDAIQTTSNKNAVFDRLIYSNVFEGNIKVDENGNPLPLGKQFYETDAKGNFVTNTDGSYIIRNGLDAGTASYLMDNPTLVNSLKDYNIVATESNSLNGFTGMAISNEKTPKEVIFSSRGTEPSQINDLVADAILAVNEYSPIETSNAQVTSANEFAKSVLADTNITEAIFTGHSLGGYLAQVQAASTQETFADRVTITQVDTFNAPQAGEYIRSEYGSEVANSINNVAYSHITVGDVVSRSGNISGQEYVIGQVMMYSNTDGGPASHSITYFTDANQSTFNTTLLSKDGAIVTENLAQVLSSLDTQLAEAKAAIDGLDTWDNAMAYSANKLGVAGADNPYARLESIQQAKASLDRLLGNVEGYNEFKANYASISSIQETVAESLGGEQAQAVLDKVADAAVTKSVEEKEAFVESLADSAIVKSVMDAVLGTDGSFGIQSVDKLVLDKFIQANTQRYGDPLVVDLDGDGIETRGADGSVLFDHNADGVRTGTGWVNKDDGLLVRDIDGNGIIDNGRELFGDNTIKSDGTKATDGFDALRDLDSNNDGIFDANDEAFHEVKIWQDKDQDGVSDDGELISLSDAGIDSIDLNAKIVNQSVAGGILRKTSTATNTDGSTTTIGAMDFAENKFYSKFEEILQTSQDLQNSINVAGQGALRSLHESASQSPKLNELLKGLYSGATAVTDSAVHEVLLEWAKTANNFSTSLEILDGVTLDDGTQINVGISDRVRTVIEKTAILEALNGERLLSYNIKNNGSSYTISAQTGSESFWETRTVAKGGTTTTNDWFFHRLADNARATHISEGYASAFNSIKESVETSFIVREIQPFLLENLSFELDEAGEIALSFEGINEAIVEKIKADPVTGLNFYKNVIDVQDVTFLKDGWDYSSILGEANFTAEEVVSINAVEFKLDGKQIILSTDRDDNLSGFDSADAIYGNDGNDKLYGKGGNDLLDGGLGDDILRGESGNDILLGGEGNDNLVDNEGSNVLDGGSGDDWVQGEGTLRGGEGSDGLWADEYSTNTLEGGQGDDRIYTGYRSTNTIKYNLGDGFDLVARQGDGSAWGRRYEQTYNDRILFGEGISQSDLKLSNEGNDLIIQVGEDPANGMRVEGFYSTNRTYQSKVNRLEFADGTVLRRGVDAIFNPNFETTEEVDDITGSEWNDVIDGKGGNDILRGGLGNDKLVGGEGDDTLRGDSGNDILLGGEGNDNLVDNEGSNVLDGGSGDDWVQGEGTLRGGEGSDGLWADEYSTNTLEGGRGDDRIYTGYRSTNTIKYNLGDGFDLVARQGDGNAWGRRYEQAYNDKILFGEGITKEDLKLNKEGNDLIIQVGEDSANGMRVEGFYSTNKTYQSKVNRLEFADGTVLRRGVDAIFNPNFETTEEVDDITGSEWNDVIDGKGGNDILRGGLGNDKLVGGEGDDTLRGDSGNDILLGGEGNDNLVDNEGSNVLDGGSGDDWVQGEGTLRGGEGSDGLWADEYSTNTLEGGQGDDRIYTGYRSTNTIKYNLGDGFDLVARQGDGNAWGRRYEQVYNDKILFGEGITKEDLKLNKEGNDLIIQVGEDSANGMRVEGFYSTNKTYQSKVNRLEFADGTVLGRSDILVGTESDDVLVGNNNDNIIVGNGGDDTIITGSGNDYLRGGEGADTYVINVNDTGTKTIDMSSNDNSIDTIRLEGVNSSDVGFEVQDNDLAILLRGNSGDLISKVIVNNFYDEANENADNIQIETADALTDIPNFGEQMRQLKAMMEAEEAVNDIDDGGAISGSQVTTQVGNSELLDIWAPKSEIA
ncbi:hypothetical protein CGC44_04110 [Francisella opportunistica]|uniref:Uncharacterized protein n=1 Tax=Francisella opportunistica TaxID=2016517 RepID=A0A345JR85_9GAMM|nr:hypothetical protein [Francisella opportunistica]AXH29831.1 hypothetical protein CGC43_04150 [Francisella opportunistica]AXH31480.1 hypothetical protein CGC44_04110 [Francisella opportunistica]